MDKKDFFIRKDDIITLDVFGQVFKFRKVTAGDELDWIDEYTEITEEKQADGTIKRVAKENVGKLMMCKLRNIVEVPFDNIELRELSGNPNPWAEYTNAEKDLVFSQLDPRVMNELIRQIDNSKKSQLMTP